MMAGGGVQGRTPAPTPSPAESTSVALDRAASAVVAPALLIAGLAYLLFSGVSVFLPSGPHAATLADIDAVIGVGFLAAFVLNQWRPVEARHANVALGLMLVSVIGELSFGSFTGVEPDTVLYYALVLLAVAWLVTSTAWFAALSLATLASWAVAAALHPGVVSLETAIVLPVAAATLAAVTFAGRVRAQAEVARLRQEDARLTEALRSATNAAEENERRLRTVVENAPVILFALDRNGRLTLSEGRALDRFGLRPGEAVGQPVRAFFADPAQGDAVVRRVLAGEEVRLEADVTNGATMEVHYSPLRDENGAPQGAICVATDVTERKKAEEALRRTDRLSALGTLVAGVAHEINNPLQFMMGQVELSKLELEDAADLAHLPPDARGHVQEALRRQDIVLKGVRRIAGIAASLKQVVRARDAVRAPENLNDLADGVLTLVQPRIPDSVSVVRDFQARSHVPVSAQEISQVILNLVVNAADAMATRDSGTLTVRTRDTPGGVAVEVEDTGTGIPADQTTRLFTPFHTTKEKGTGLGLSICHGIVEEHGGRITFDTRPGQGTTFVVELPRSDGSATARANVEAARARAPAA